MITQTDRDILNKAATKLEILAQAIREENKELFDDLTYDADDAYCLGVGIVANVNLDEVHSIIFRSNNGNWNYFFHLMKMNWMLLKVNLKQILIWKIKRKNN